MKRRLAVTAVAATMALTGQMAVPALADEGRGVEAVPFEFVGKAGDCGAAAGSRIVTAAWLKGMGLPDADDPNKKDHHSGLLLSKNGPTADCSAAGASIKGVKGMTVSETFEVGFDYRNGGHCGAGAPRSTSRRATASSASSAVARTARRRRLRRTRQSGRASGSTSRVPARPSRRLPWAARSSRSRSSTMRAPTRPTTTRRASASRSWTTSSSTGS